MPFSTASPDAYVAIAMQSALGTPQTTAAKYRFVKYSSGNNVGVQVAVTDIREGGDGLDFGISYQNRVTAEGQITGNLRPEIAGQIFQLLPGGATWTGGSAPALHRFQALHASHPWATLQVAHPGTDMIQLLRDVRLLGLTLTFQTGRPLYFSAPFRGVAPGASTNIALTPSYPNGDDLFLYHSVPSAQLDGSGAGATYVEEVRIDFRLGVEDLQAQQPTLDEIVVMNRDADITIMRRYENSTLYKKILYGGGVAPTTSVATGSLDFYWTNNQAGANKKTMQFVAPLISYRGDVLTELDPDGRTVKETVTGKMLRGASGIFYVNLENAHASAYGP